MRGLAVVEFGLAGFPVFLRYVRLVLLILEDHEFHVLVLDLKHCHNLGSNFSNSLSVSGVFQPDANLVPLGLQLHDHTCNEVGL